LRIHIGSDHAGFPLKETVKAYLLSQGHDVTDVGADSEESVDYPIFAQEVGLAVSMGRADSGILVCGTGLGMAIAANKVRGVRAVQITDPAFAELTRRHNDANVLSLAGRFTDEETAKRIVDTFLNTPFEGGRHVRRVEQIHEIEQPADPGPARS
jgi:ribose 5-phosphate isomerase B